MFSSVMSIAVCCLQPVIQSCSYTSSLQTWQTVQSVQIDCTSYWMKIFAPNLVQTNVQHWADYGTARRLSTYSVVKSVATTTTSSLFCRDVRVDSKYTGRKRPCKFWWIL